MAFFFVCILEMLMTDKGLTRSVSVLTFLRGTDTPKRGCLVISRAFHSQTVQLPEVGCCYWGLSWNKFHQEIDLGTLLSVFSR